MDKVYSGSVLVLFFATWAAGSLPYMDTEELVEGSTLVVVGTVDRVVSYYTDEGYIYSRAYIAASDFIMGDNERATVEVIYPGGTVDGVGMATSISPRLESGTEVMLFLRKDDAGEYVLTNHGASKFTVEDGWVVENGAKLEDYIAEVEALVRR